LHPLREIEVTWRDKLRLCFVVEAVRFVADGRERAQNYFPDIALHYPAIERLRSGRSAEQLRARKSCWRIPDAKEGDRAAEQSHELRVLRVYGLQPERHGNFVFDSVAVLPSARQGEKFSGDDITFH
jgi:hypothetical protein